VGRRRRGRELAVKVLYRLDLAGETWDEVRPGLEEYDALESVRVFGARLVEAALANRDAIDRILAEAAVNWEVRRMALIDRNVLRMAIAEYLVLAETPAAVIIDEAVEIASRFSTEGSGAFVNGILDRIVHTHAPGALVGSAPPGEEGDERDPGAEPPR
jgi:N utilization substance protein B